MNLCRHDCRHGELETRSTEDGFGGGGEALVPDGEEGAVGELDGGGVAEVARGAVGGDGRWGRTRCRRGRG